MSKQEIRNCIYSGKFNTLILKLASNNIFAEAWDIPLNDQDKLRTNNFYKKMEDVELILRFFALRHVDEFRKGMEGFLDLYMMKSLDFSDEDIEILEQIFIDTINLASQIYQEKLFKPFDPQSNKWKDKSYKAYYDAVMVGFNRHLNNADLLVERKSRIIKETKELLAQDKRKIFTGGGRTKADIHDRIKLFDDMLTQIMAE